jgi:hypothetical protein
MKSVNSLATQRQSGAALLVSLVFIFMMTVIGISAMKGATLEGQLANNAIQKEMTLQAAEAASNARLNEPNSLEDSICIEDPIGLAYGNLKQSDEQATDSEVEYGGRANPVGYSLGGPIGARRFVVTGTSAIDSINTSSRVSQGVILIGASDMGGDC